MEFRTGNPFEPDRRTTPEVSDESSIELVARLHAGDQRSWETLYLRYRDRLILSIRCRLGPHLRSRLESEDILQSVFKDVIEDVVRFEHRGTGSLNRYLHACVLNKIRRKAEHFSARKRSGEIPLSDSILDRIPGSTEAEPNYIDAERFEMLERALARLPEEMREVIVLRRVEELSNIEAARTIGKTPEATSKLYNRSLARLAVWMRPGSRMSTEEHDE